MLGNASGSHTQRPRFPACRFGPIIALEYGACASSRPKGRRRYFQNTYRQNARPNPMATKKNTTTIPDPVAQEQREALAEPPDAPKHARAPTTGTEANNIIEGAHRD
jgi:hypothetical protein